MGPLMAPRYSCRYLVSPDRLRSGVGKTSTVKPSRCRCRTTPFQLELSAHAPWTRTTVGLVVWRTTAGLVAWAAFASGAVATTVATARRAASTAAATSPRFRQAARLRIIGGSSSTEQRRMPGYGETLRRKDGRQHLSDDCRGASRSLLAAGTRGAPLIAVDRQWCRGRLDF